LRGGAGKVNGEGGGRNWARHDTRLSAGPVRCAGPEVTCRGPSRKAGGRKYRPVRLPMTSRPVRYRCRSIDFYLTSANRACWSASRSSACDDASATSAT
jgi:hypothetical protein